jgi:hypothetical protein
MVEVVDGEVRVGGRLKSWRRVFYLFFHHVATPFTWVILHN